MPRTIQCATCGTTTTMESSRCNNCDNAILRLTIFERRKFKARKDAIDVLDYPQDNVKTGHTPHYFKSLEWFYKLSIAAGMLLAIYLYLFAFNDFSEEELVMLSFVWVLALHFGSVGLYGEKAVKLVLKGEVNTFQEGLQKASIFLRPIPYMLYRFTKLSSPLWLSYLTALVWAILLVLFFVGIFPAL